MNNLHNSFSWFLDHTFGLGLKTGEANSLLDSHVDREKLRNVAIRLWFTDLLRYRTMFLLGNVNPSEIPDFLGNEIQALNQYLLFTCIDALASNDFITFPDWLNIKKKGKKKQYKIKDDEILNMISTGDLKAPDTFRKAAYNVFENCYKKYFGNKVAINNFLLALPEEAKEFLVDLYVIVTTIPIVDVLSVDQDGCPIDIVKDWTYEINKWVSNDLDYRISIIAAYYYNCLRNPYTHNAKTTTQKSRLYHCEFVQNDSYFLYDYYPEKKLLVRFKQKSIENEILIIRLIVIIGWLSKVGREIDKDLINKYRLYQLRREFMSFSIKEIEGIKELALLYRNEIYQTLLRLTARWSLKGFNYSYLCSLKDHFRPEMPLEKGIIETINNLLINLRQLNALISEQNQKYIPKDTLVPSEEEGKTLSRVMPIAFNEIKKTISQLEIEKTCDEIYEYLNQRIEWIVE